MSYYDYQPPNKFGFKDTLPEGDAEKIIKGSEFDDEFNKISAESQAIDQAQQEFDGRLDEEIENRIEGDQNLQNQIDNIVGGNIEIDPDQIPGLPELIDDALSGKADKDHTHDEYLTDAPNDTKQYVRQSKAWAEVTIPDGAPPSWGEITDKPLTYPPEDHTHDQYALGTELEAEIQARIAGDKALEEDIEDLEAAIGAVIGQLAFGGSYDASTGLVAKANISALTDGQPLPDYSQVTGTFVIVVVAGNNPEELDEADWLVAGEAGWVAIKYGTAGSVAWENVVGAPDFLTDAQGSIDGDSKEYVRKNGEWVEGSVGGSSLWEQNGDDIYYNEGNVGIGTETPAETLTVSGPILSNRANYGANQNQAYMIAAAKNYNGSTTNWGTHGYQHKIKSNSSGGSRITIDSRQGEVWSMGGEGHTTFAGNVGIGMTPLNRNAKEQLAEWSGWIEAKLELEPSLDRKAATLDVTDGAFEVLPTEEALAEWMETRAAGDRLQVNGNISASGTVNAGKFVSVNSNGYSSGLMSSRGNGTDLTLIPIDANGGVADGTVSLGRTKVDNATSLAQFKDAYFSGTVNADYFHRPTKAGIGFVENAVCPLDKNFTGTSGEVDLGRTAQKWKDAHFTGTVEAGTVDTGNISASGTLEFGAIGINAPDADTVTKPGFYCAADLSTVTNWPDGSGMGSGPGALQTFPANNANNAVQFAYGLNNQKAFFRSYRSSNWKDWREFVTADADGGVTHTGKVSISIDENGGQALTVSNSNATASHGLKVVHGGNGSGTFPILVELNSGVETFKVDGAGNVTVKGSVSSNTIVTNRPGNGIWLTANQGAASTTFNHSGGNTFEINPLGSKMLVNGDISATGTVNAGLITTTHSAFGVFYSNVDGNNGAGFAPAGKQTHGVFVNGAGTVFSPSLDDTLSLGAAGARWKNAHVSGTVNANKFVGDGSGLTNLPVQTVDAYTKTESDNKYQPKGTYLTQSTADGRYVAKSGNTTISGTLTATDFVATSDERLKQNTATAPLGLVDQLRGVEFEWKEDGRQDAGVIAQEVEKVLPHLVHDTGEHKAVNYNGLVAYLIEEVKALRAEVEALKS